MGAYERMHALLRSTGLYRLDGNSATDIELKRYAHYLDILESNIKVLPEDAFADTFQGDGYYAWLELLALPEGTSWATLRKIVQLRLGINNRDFTKAGVKRCMASGGFTVNLTEDFANDIVTVEILEDKKLFGTKTEKEEFLRSCLPCHVQGVFIWP